MMTKLIQSIRNKWNNILKSLKYKYLRNRKSKMYLEIEIGEIILAPLTVILEGYRCIYPWAAILSELFVIISSLYCSYRLFRAKHYSSLMKIFRYSFALGAMGLLGATGIAIWVAIV